MLPNFLAQPGLMLRLLLELQQEQANGAPVECLYCGTFVLSDRGSVLEVTEQMIDELVRNFAALDGPERIPISVNHNTGGDTLETARAIGWIVRLFKQTSEEGRISLFMEPRWLDDAREAIEQEHFRFVSIGMYLNDKHPTSGEAIGAHAKEVSVTNSPAIPGLEPITLTALNSPSKVALSVQSVMALHPGNPVELAMNGGLPGSLMERVDCVIRCFYEQNRDSNEVMWIVRDVATDQCIVSRRNAEGEKTWQVGYQMAADGTCTFAPMPQWVEVRQVYVPVTASMSKADPGIKLAAKTPDSANPKQLNQSKAAGTAPVAITPRKGNNMDELLTQIRSILGLAADADPTATLSALVEKGKEIDGLKAKVAELEQVKASAATAEAKLATQEGQITTLTQQKTAFEQETTTLSTRLKTLEDERSTRDAKDRIDLALKNRKVLPAELAAEDRFLAKLAKEQPATFDKIMSARPAYAVNLTVEIGSGAEGQADENDVDRLFRLVDEKLAADVNLNAQDARKLVLAAHPELKGAIKTIQAG